MSEEVLHKFYCSKAWLDLAKEMKIKSGGICARCGKVYDINELRPHHKIELTIDNVDDPAIALNPINIEVLCQNCHNAVHKRFGGGSSLKNVYLVYGSPFAGKHEYVRTVATRDDLIVDMDAIQRAISITTEYDKPDATKKISFQIRDYLLDEIKTATPYRKWEDAYIIGTYPSRYDREELERELGATPIHIDTPRKECEAKAKATVQSPSAKEEVLRWIAKYFDKYSE